MKPPTKQRIIYPGLAQAMEDHEFSQTSIAKALHISKSTLQKKLSGKSRLHVDEAIAIMRLFPGWTLDDLFMEGTE